MEVRRDKRKRELTYKKRQTNKRTDRRIKKKIDGQAKRHRNRQTHLDKSRMAVSLVDGGVGAQEVEVPLSLHVPHKDACRWEKVNGWHMGGYMEDG